MLALKIIKICLWLVVGAFAAWGALLIINVLRGTETLPDYAVAFGLLMLMFAALAAGAIVLSNRWPVALALATVFLIVGFPIAFFGSWWYGAERDAARRRVPDVKLHSGK